LQRQEFGRPPRNPAARPVTAAVQADAAAASAAPGSSYAPSRPCKAPRQRLCERGGVGAPHPTVLPTRLRSCASGHGSHRASRARSPLPGDRHLLDVDLIKPGLLQQLLSRPGAASANMPGAPGGGGCECPSATSAPSGIVTHGFSSRTSHTASARRPPDLSTRRHSRSAAAGSTVSITAPAAEDHVDAAAGSLSTQVATA